MELYRRAAGSEQTLDVAITEPLAGRELDKAQFEAAVLNLISTAGKACRAAVASPSTRTSRTRRSATRSRSPGLRLPLRDR